MSANKKISLIILALIVLLSALLYREYQKGYRLKNDAGAGPALSPDFISVPLNGQEPMLGNPGAPLTIIEINNLNDCSRQCQNQHQALVEFARAHPAQARLIWKDSASRSFLKTNNTLAHHLAWCAGQQGKFWEFTQQATQRRWSLGQKQLNQIVLNLQLNQNQLGQCLTEDAGKTQVTENFVFSQTINSADLPIIILNNRQLNLNKNTDLPALLNLLVSQ